MKNYWRIYHFINTRLRRAEKKIYLEVGTVAGSILRKVEAREKHAVSDIRIPKHYLSYQWEMKVSDFCDLVIQDRPEYYSVIFLRDWKPENMLERIKNLYVGLNENGILILDHFDVTGYYDSAWKVAVGLSKIGIKLDLLKDRYLIVYKSDLDIAKAKASKMKKESYLKNPEKFINYVKH